MLAQPLTALDHVDLSAEPGVMGRADRFIETTAEYQVLARRLLGRTWLVDRVSTALRLAQSIGRGLEFVTSDGELISADGTIVVGPRQAATGVLSRRSELRACHEQAQELETAASRSRSHSLAARSGESATRAARRVDGRGLHRGCRQADRVPSENSGHGRRSSTASPSSTAEFTTTCSESRSKSPRTESRSSAAPPSAQRSRQRPRRSKPPCLKASKHSAEMQRPRRELQAAATERKIAAARCEQRVEMLRQQMEQVQRTQQERDQMLAESRERLASRETQIAEVDAAIQAGEEALSGTAA